MDRAKKSRKPVRTRVTKLCNEIDAELAAPVPDNIKLVGLLEKLHIVKEKLQEKDKDVEEAMLDENKSDQELETEEEECQGYEDKIREAEKKIKLAIPPQTTPETSSSNRESGGGHREDSRSYKLPKIELPKFDGELKNWLGWWSQFEKIDKDKSLHDSDKFQYLIQATEEKSEPREMISVFPPTGENYAAAVESLKRRYGREGLQLQVYLRELLNLVIVNVTKKEKIPLEKLYLRLESHLRALKTLDLSKAEPSMYFYPLVESSLPEEVLRTWLRNSTTTKPVIAEVPGGENKTKLDDLMDFIKKEVEGEQQISLAQNAFQEDKSKNTRASTSRNKKSDDVPTAQSLYSGSVKSCSFCDKTNHNNPECRKAQSMTLEERKQKVKDCYGCFTCLRKGHNARACKAFVKCVVCGGRHHAIMCPEKEKIKNLTEAITEKMETVVTLNPTVANASQTTKDGMVLMKTVRVNMLNSTGQKLNVRLLFDEGSNRSYVKTATAMKLKCPVLEEFNLCTTLFGGSTTVQKPKRKYRVALQSLDNKFKREFEFINEDVICGRCPTVPIGPWIKELAERKIFVNDTASTTQEVEILIGSNLWGKLMTGRMYKLTNGLIAVESVFGWTLSGEIPSGNSQENCASTVIAMLTQGEKSLPEMWDLDTIGIKDTAEKVSQEEHDQKVKTEFKKKIVRAVDGRYEVELPWIDQNIPIPTNRSVCEKRLGSLSRKLIQEELFVTYDKIFQGWEVEGLIEKLYANNNDGHYLPHHRVLKPESKTTPVRPVFDASCKVGNNPSLNECLERGPNLLELIPSILLRFREKDIGVISDIRKAFQMIKVTEKDKNFQKFLWWEDGRPEVMMEYKHSRVVFGLNCSPFMLAAVLEHHFEQVNKENEKEVVELLKTSIYVDNCVLSLDTKRDYSEFKEVSINILADAKMDLRQWESNCEKTEDDVTTVLGLRWNKVNDTISCKVRPRKVEEGEVNKRSVLSILSQVYDPIGYTCPATLQAKLMLQSAWTKELTWDEEWKEEDAKKFLTWHGEINELDRIEIPRISIGSGPSDVQLHLFTDASQDAYAAVVYARVRKGDKISVQLLLAKSRLAPLSKQKQSKKSQDKLVQKRITIPRLELLGCVIGARLLQSVRESLSYKKVKVFCWSDSSTALAWIKRDEDWGTFVGNRVREINRLTDKDQWRHVLGELNPADLPSRGCSPNELRESKWWEGPSWLYREVGDWPNSPDIPDEDTVAVEKKKAAVIVNLITDVKELRFSSYMKNVRVAAWTRRIIKYALATKVDRSKMVPQLTVEELKIGERDLLREVQEKHFPNGKTDKAIQAKKMDDGLYHIETRLTYKEDDQLFKNPILLPSHDPLVHQLIEYTHRINCHAGAQFVLNKLREKYWIVQGRRTVNKVIRKCVKCRRYASKNLPCDPAPLPIQRIESQCMFQTTGVDLAGPLILKGGKKAWIVIYTCAVYRGVFLDVLDSISSEEFLNSLHKFTCIIGRPTTIFSDNGTNFVGAHSMMKKLNWKKISDQFPVKQIIWRFNPPTAAWWGGWWERLIRTLKDLLRRMIGTAKLTRKELETCMAEISHVMNNRPLTTLTENETDLIPLTPAMFMRDLPITGLPEVEAMTSKDLQEAYCKLNGLKAALNARFRKEYLGNLIQKKAEKSSPDPKVGDIVLVGSENRKRFEWPLGRIVELYPGKDKKIRVAKVRTARGTIERPLQRLYPLEISTPSDVVVTEELKQVIKTQKEKEAAEGMNANSNEQTTVKTKSGREIKKPLRYGKWSNY